MLAFCRPFERRVNGAAELRRQHKYKFTAEEISLSEFNFPETTKWKALDSGGVVGKYLVDCEGNFSEDEKATINRYNIHNVEELIRNQAISKTDKARCLKCLKYVRERFELFGIEPFNGHTSIKLEKYLLGVRILRDGGIKFCNSQGERDHSDFVTIGLA